MFKKEIVMKKHDIILWDFWDYYDWALDQIQKLKELLIFFNDQSINVKELFFTVCLDFFFRADLFSVVILNSKKYNTSNCAIKKSSCLLWIHIHSATQSRVLYNFGIIRLTFRIYINERKPITTLMMSILRYFSKKKKKYKF